MLEDYLEKRRTGNKSDDDVLKDTFLKIGCCIMILILVFAIAFTILLISNDFKEVNITETVLKGLSKIYPKIAEGAAASNDL